jgi:hypothetical protein
MTRSGLNTARRRTVVMLTNAVPGVDVCGTDSGTTDSRTTDSRTTDSRRTDSRPGSGISAISMAGETGPIRRIERRGFAFAAEISSCAMTVPIRRSGVSIRNP